MTSTSPVRLGVVGSSAGGALASASVCLAAAGKAVEWVVVTDRPCGLGNWARAKGHSVRRIAYTDAETFSHETCAVFDAAECENVLLFYTRRVASPLIDQKRVWNIHPALLPAFPGLNGVRDSLEGGARILGATLHRVDNGLDTGPIVAQVAAPIPEGLSLVEAQHISYLQKVWLTLVWFDQLEMRHQKPESSCIGPGVFAASPGLADDRLRRSYVEWLAAEAIEANPK